MDILATHVQKKNTLNDGSPLDLSSGPSTWRLPFFIQQGLEHLAICQDLLFPSPMTFQKSPLSSEACKDLLETNPASLPETIPEFLS